MKLPPPMLENNLSVAQAIHQRRTVRAFSSQALERHHLAQLLWSAQGITGPKRFKRAAPSAGALYPMDIYAVVGERGVTALEAGIYRYVPENHEIGQHVAGDLRLEIAGASLHQRWMAAAPLDIVITAAYDRITGKYGRRGVRYAMMEAGHIGQNLFLQAEALGLKAGIVGAFDDAAIVRVMKLPSSHEPLLIIPVGYAGRS